MNTSTTRIGGRNHRRDNISSLRGIHIAAHRRVVEHCRYPMPDPLVHPQPNVKSPHALHPLPDTHQTASSLQTSAEWRSTTGIAEDYATNQEPSALHGSGGKALRGFWCEEHTTISQALRSTTPWISMERDGSDDKVPRRQQYSSCDECRRARVGCDAGRRLDDATHGNKACTRCLNRQKRCTFEVSDDRSNTVCYAHTFVHSGCEM